LLRKLHRSHPSLVAGVSEEVRYRASLSAATTQSEYITGMNNKRDSDTSQVLWFDAAVILIIAVVVMVSNMHPHFGHLLHHGR